MKNLFPFVILLSVQLSAHANSITLTNGSEIAYIAITARNDGVALSTQGRRVGYRWKSIKADSLPFRIRDQHRKRVVALLIKAQGILDDGKHIEAMNLFRKADGHLGYLKPSDLKEPWGKDAARKVRGFLEVDGKWLEKNVAFQQLGYRLDGDKWLSFEKYHAHQHEERLKAEAKQAERERHEVEQRRAAEVERKQREASAALRANAFASKENIARYFKLMLSNPVTYRHSHGQVTVWGDIRLGDVTLGVDRAWVKFKMNIRAGGKVSQREVRLGFVKDFDGWEMDSDWRDSAHTSDSYDFTESYEWAPRYLNYLLFGR